MAVLATGLGRLTGLGGALFMLSDSLIALKAFREWDGRALSMAVMGTYAAAEALLVMGIVRHVPDSPISGQSARSGRRLTS